MSPALSPGPSRHVYAPPGPVIAALVPMTTSQGRPHLPWDLAKRLAEHFNQPFPAAELGVELSVSTAPLLQGLFISANRGYLTAAVILRTPWLQGHACQQGNASTATIGAFPRSISGVAGGQREGLNTAREGCPGVRAPRHAAITECPKITAPCGPALTLGSQGSRINRLTRSKT